MVHVQAKLLSMNVVLYVIRESDYGFFCFSCENIKFFSTSCRNGMCHRFRFYLFDLINYCPIFHFILWKTKHLAIWCENNIYIYPDIGVSSVFSIRKVKCLISFQSDIYNIGSTWGWLDFTFMVLLISENSRYHKTLNQLDVTVCK